VGGGSSGRATGSIEEVANRWAARGLWQALKDDAHVDLDVRRKDVNTRIGKLREALTSAPVDEKSIIPRQSKRRKRPWS